MLIADLHIHSKYSRATSKDCIPEALDLWARKKGIVLLGTGDFTHPAWRKTLQETLVPAEDGLYRLKEELVRNSELSGALEAAPPPRFVVSGEISSIYKKNGKTRKVHNLILLPGLEEAEALSRKLEAIGNIHSDGRPILGLDSRDLLEITLDACPNAIFIPAHIWTPHFSLFGAFSGFDTIEECFEDLTPHIHALETGLSSDPPMNWRLSALDGYHLVSNSDAHSPQKLGREANLLEIPLVYSALEAALREGSSAGLAGTIEFFPEEGKYHLDGHRNCSLCLTPAETIGYGGKCPVCGKKITIGVEHRVEELADRPQGIRPAQAPGFESLVPLPEVIAASTGNSAASKKTAAQYEQMLTQLGPEFTILRETPLEEIRAAAGPCVEEGIRRLRLGKVERVAGYDGEYGTISLLSPDEIETLNGQVSFQLEQAPQKKKSRPAPQPELSAPLGPETPAEPSAPASGAGPLDGLNTQQRRAVESDAQVLAVIAGPGTGKTKTLIARIIHLVQEKGVKPSEITAVTFTNKAAAELKERLSGFGSAKEFRGIHVGTFHSICLQELQKERDFSLLGESDARVIAKEVLEQLDCPGSPARFLEELSRRKNGSALEKSQFPEEAFFRYQEELSSRRAMDFDDLLLEAACLSENAKRPKNQFAHLLVDEFQDINLVQYRLLQAWAKGGKSLFVIGDPDQSIYGFRGADANCFDRLAQDLPHLEVIRLLVNYRSSPQILNCALPLISQNPGDPRELIPNSPPGAPVRLITAPTPLAEGIFIAKEINRMVGGMDLLDAQALRDVPEIPCGFSDIAVLYRTHHQARILEQCLQKENIPYRVAGREPFWEDAAVQGVLSLLRFWLNPSDSAGFQTALEQLWQVPKDLRLRLAVIQTSLDSPNLTELLNALRTEFGSSGYLQPLFQLSEELWPQIRKAKPLKATVHLWEQLKLPETDSQNKLINTASCWDDLPGFLQAVALGQEADLMRGSSKSRNYGAGAVTLMTLHGSKGLEFSRVFLCGVTDTVLPLSSPNRPCDLWEERRLFYVGMTRAREQLILTGYPERSPFLKEIPSDLLRAEKAIERPAISSGKQLSFF